jgi:PS-10 peptidase S37
MTRTHSILGPLCRGGLLIGLLVWGQAGCGDDSDSSPAPSKPQEEAGVPDAEVELEAGEPDAGELDAGEPDAQPEAAPDVVEEPDALDDRDIAERLADLDNVTAVQEFSPSSEGRRFLVDFTLPLDHDNPQGPTFIQSAFIYHRSDTAPTVLETSGYGLGEIDDYWSSEPTELLGANQVMLGHRFFEGGSPDEVLWDWNLLTIEQSAKDTHEIVGSLKDVYPQNWVGTGWSKGGMTILFQEYFYPDDLDLALPMVAPISLALNDQRYPPHLAAIGTPACRELIDVFILECLTRLDELVEALGPMSAYEKDYYRDYLKNAAVSYQWPFWQYVGIDYCDSLPGEGASAEDLLDAVTFATFFPAPPGLAELQEYAYYYQSLSQLGAPDFYPPGYLQNMVDLGFLTQQEVSAYQSVEWPYSDPPQYDPAPMATLDAWLRTSAEDIVAVYGEYDPWSGGRVTLNPALRTEVLTAPGTSHATFLRDLPDVDYARVVSRIMEMAPATRHALPISRRPSEGDRAKLRTALRQRAL